MKRILITLIIVCGLMTATIAQEKPKNGFKSTLSVGVSLTDGNSETLQANAAIITEGEKTVLSP